MLLLSTKPLRPVLRGVGRDLGCVLRRGGLGARWGQCCPVLNQAMLRAGPAEGGAVGCFRDARGGCFCPGCPRGAGRF